MAKLKAALKRVAEGLGLQKPLLARAQRRYKANRKRAFKAHNQQLAAQKRADRYRAEAQKALRFGATENQTEGERLIRKADAEDKRVRDLKKSAYQNHLRAEHYLGAIKKLQQRINGLETTQAGLEAELKKFDHVTIKGDKATGGSVHERLKAVALKSAAECAAGNRANFYDQGGRYDVSHCITGPSSDCRDDCSSWKTSAHKSAGLKDPNGLRYGSGYTETLRNYAVANHLVVTRAELKPGGSVIYGPPGATHHVEMYVGPGEKTIGHGSAPVDAGIVDLFGPDEYMTFCNYHD
jgi:hypothetical protein